MPSASLTPTLEKNLRALALSDRALSERLLEPCAVDHVILSPDGPPLVRHHGALLPMEVGPDAREALLAGWPSDEPEALLFGLGLGELLAHLLRRRPEGSLVAFERDPWLVRETLSRWDYSASLETGRLRIALGVDLALDLERLSTLPRIEHPTLREVYEAERLLLEDPGDDGPWAAVGLGGHFVEDLAKALRDEGYRAVPVELSRWSKLELRSALSRLDPALVVTVNMQEGLDELCASLDKPLYVWEVDPSVDRLVPPTHAKTTRVFTCRRPRVDDLEAAGYEAVAHLPLAADPAKRHPVALDEGEAAHYTAPVCFVGASLAASAEEYRRKFLHLYASWRCGPEAGLEEGERRLEELLAAQSVDDTSDRIPELAEEYFGDLLRAARISRTRQDPVSWLDEIAAAGKRQRYVSSLGKFGVCVWGDDGWSDIHEHGGRYMGRAGHREELTHIYSSGALHVDVNRLVQPDSVSLRVFEVLACGGFLLAEHSEALDALFSVGTELETYRTRTELHEKVGHFLAHPEEAAEVAARGRAAVLDRHTVGHRVRTMLAGS